MRPHRVALACLLAVLALALVPSLASAKQARLFAGSFGEASSSPADPYPLLNPQQIAVEEATGDVYVTDNFFFEDPSLEAHRVEKFDASGHFILMFGQHVNKTAMENPSSNEAERDLCTAESGDVCTGGERTNHESPTPFEEPGFVAVDNSSGPSHGDVYVSSATGESAHPEDVIYKLTPGGQLISGWASGGVLDGSTVLDPPAPVAGPFGNVTGMTVDPEGDLWMSATLGSQLRVFEFGQDGSFITGFEGGSGQLAIDAEQHLYEVNAGLVDKLTTTTGKDLGVVAPNKAEFEQEFGFFTPFEPGGNPSSTVRGLAVDATTGDLYLDGFEEGGKPSVHGVIRRYDGSCHPVVTEFDPQPGCSPAESFGAGLLSEHVRGLAVDSASEAAYVVDDGHFTEFALLTVPDTVTSKPLSPTKTTATLAGTVDPSGVELNAGLAGCRFEWGETTAYGNTAPCDKTAAEIGTGMAPVEVRAAIAGSQAGRVYHYRLVTSNANDVNASIQEPSFGEDLSFGPPLIESASAVSVNAGSAVVQVQLNPQSLDTRVRVEYVSQKRFEATGYSEPLTVGPRDAGAAGSSQSVEFALSALAADTTYHYRAVAENVLGEGAEAVVGADETFTTQITSAGLLLDGRAWEPVSPADKHGARIETISEAGVIQAAVDGSAISYLANAPTEAGVAGNANSAVQVLSVRSAGGWRSLDLAMPHDEIVGTPSFGPGPDYKSFSSDLSAAVADEMGRFVPEVSPQASEKTPYLRQNFPAGEPGDLCSLGCYGPLVTGKPGVANVPPGTEFGREATCKSNQFCGPVFLGGTPDLSHVVLSSKAALVEGAPEEGGGLHEGGLYEWAAGRLELVSVLPGEAGPAPSSSVPKLGSADPGRGGEDKNARNAISNDGSRVIWSTEHTGHLYLRDGLRGETVQLDAKQGGTGTGPVTAHFQGASADGSVVFFTDDQQLTSGSGAKSTEPDLYRCDMRVGESGELECVLSDLTPAHGAESAVVRGAIPGAGNDGNNVYFFARSVLTNAPNARGEHAKPAACPTIVAGPANEALADIASCNLYVDHGGTTRFIAAVSGNDDLDWEGRLSLQGTRVSPDGQWLAFLSQRSLTGYDNRDVASGRPVSELYLYDAGTDRVLCGSCDPTGARPHGLPANQYQQRVAPGARGTVNEGALVAASVPAWTAMDVGVNRYQDRYLSDSGRLFFNAVDALVPQDSNGKIDVYEYEPAGVGSCSEIAASYSPVSGGCVGLISSGVAGGDSMFMDASETGDDVFFLTAAQLSKRDTDTAPDVYDARVGGGESEPASRVACQGDACQGFVEAPSDPTPGSLVFSGPGNLTPLAPVVKPAVKPKSAAQLRAAKLKQALKACKARKSKRKRQACEVQARKRYGPLKAKKAANMSTRDRRTR
jgi:hypothetical protein